MLSTDNFLTVKLKNNAIVRSKYFAIFSSEFFCTFFFVTCVTSNIAILKLSPENSYNIIGTIFGAALSVIFTIQMGFLISGGQVNPAVSLFFLVLGHMNWKEFIVYCIAQTLGAFFGAATTFAVYYDAIHNFDGGVRSVIGENATAAIFATFPQHYLSVTGGILDLTISTAVLTLTILPVIDERNGIPKWAQPTILGVGLVVTALTFSLNTGSALNPARDFGPRVFLLCAHYGWEVFSYNNYKWFWIPIVCPPLGGLIGTFLYKSFISPFLPKLKKSTFEEQKSMSEIDFPEIVIKTKKYVTRNGY